MYVNFCYWMNIILGKMKDDSNWKKDWKWYCWNSNTHTNKGYLSLQANWCQTRKKVGGKKVESWKLSYPTHTNHLLPTQPRKIDLRLLFMWFFRCKNICPFFVSCENSTARNTKRMRIKTERKTMKWRYPGSYKHISFQPSKTRYKAATRTQMISKRKFLVLFLTFFFFF